MVPNAITDTAIAAMMGLLNEIFEVGSLTADEFKIFLRLLCPFAPHICEELWEEISLIDAEDIDTSEFFEIYEKHLGDQFEFSWD